jgi:ABC-type multidrug transport system ATPase subunit
MQDNNYKTSNEPIIAVRGFTKKFGKFTSTSNVSFDVTRGSIHAFIGPNGSGKTTTIKSIA